jgi:transcriptional regulator with XRE-family HTH domain
MKRLYLKKQRKKLGFSIEDIAFQIGISYNYLLNIENGIQGKQASFLLMGKIAEVYQLQLVELYKQELQYQKEKGYYHD